MKKFGVIFGFLALSALSAFGTILTNSCAETGQTTFSLSTAPTSIECGDKVFSGFTSTGAAAGTITIKETTPTQYLVTLSAPVGGISAVFTYGFTVMVDTSICPNCVISQIQQNMQTGAQIPNGSTGGNTINNGGVFSPATTNGLTVGGQNALAAGLTQTSYAVGFSFNPTGNGGQPAGTFLNLDDVITQSSVPEPVTFSLMGIGLLGLGLLRKRLS